MFVSLSFCLWRKITDILSQSVTAGCVPPDNADTMSALCYLLSALSTLHSALYSAITYLHSRTQHIFLSIPDIS